MRERETDVPGAAGGTATGVSHDARAPGPVQDVERGPRRWWTGRVRGGRDPGSRDRTREHGTNGTAPRVVLGHQPLEELSNTVPDSLKSAAARSLVLGRPVAGAPEQEAARGDVGGHPEHDPEVGGNAPATHGDRRAVRDRAVLEDRDVGRVAADVGEDHPELPVPLGKHRLGRRERREDELVDLDAGPLHALRQVLHARRRGRDDVRFDLQADRAHADRVADPLLAVHDVAPRDDVEDLARVSERHGARGLDGAERVVSAHVVAMAGDGDHAAGVLRADVAAGDADEGGAHLQPGEALRGLDGVRDGLDGPVDVDDDAFAEAVGRSLADADDVDPAASGELADEDADLRRADVYRDEYRLVRHLCLP